MVYWDGPYIEKGLYDNIFCEAFEKCKENFNETVKSYINQSTEELNATNKIIKSLQQKIKELSSQVKDADEIREAIRKELLDAMWEDVKPGDNVWLIKSENMYKKCEKCNGTRKVKAITSDGIEVEATCPNCEYNGVRTGVKRTVYSQKLDNITRTLSIYNNKLVFYIGGENYTENGEVKTALCRNGIKGDAFRTKEEAEFEIKRLENIGDAK